MATLLTTCGSASKRKEFSYEGSVDKGVVLKFETGDFAISAQIISIVLEQFRGKTVRGGFSMTDPTPGGVGEFLQQQGNGLTPRHASFLCAILQHEGLVECSLDGNAVVVSF